MNIIDILSQPGGFEVAWDYCLQENICLPVPVTTYRGLRGIRMSRSGGPSRVFRRLSASGDPESTHSLWIVSFTNANYYNGSRSNGW